MAKYRNRNNGYKYKSHHYMNAVILDIERGERRGRKYHKIYDSPHKIADFIALAKRKFPAAVWVYFYDEVTRQERYRFPLQEKPVAQVKGKAQGKPAFLPFNETNFMIAVTNQYIAW